MPDLPVVSSLDDVGETQSVATLIEKCEHMTNAGQGQSIQQRYVFSHAVAGISVGLICCTVFYFCLLRFLREGPNGFPDGPYVVIANQWFIPSGNVIIFGFFITPLCATYSLLRARFRPIAVLGIDWVVAVLACLIPFAFLSFWWALLAVAGWGM